MTEDQLNDLWAKVYEHMDIAIDHGVYPDEVADKVVELVKEILGEE